jgi:phage host-nuclease inhibitor protein Gam
MQSLVKELKKRLKVKGAALKSWDEVDDKLKRIGELGLRLEEMERSMNTTITGIKEGTKASAKPLLEEQERLSHLVREYAEENAAAFGKRKSLDLTHGKVGWRKSTSLKIKRVADTLTALKAQGMSQYIRAKESVDKEGLRDLGDHVLTMLGVQRKVDDVFFLEPDREKIREVV